MHSRVYRFLEKYNLLYKNQFGFRKKHSTNHAILSIVEDIHENLACNNFVCGVFIDLEKAFDTVNHEILLQKLNFYGIRGTSNLQIFGLNHTSRTENNVLSTNPHSLKICQ